MTIHPTPTMYADADLNDTEIVRAAVLVVHIVDDLLAELAALDAAIDAALEV